MSKAPVGALVRLYYDSPTRVQPGDALVTRSGRLYLVAEARRQTRGVHIGRQHLSCIVASSDAEVSGQIHSVFWYPRGRRGRPTTR